YCLAIPGKVYAIYFPKGGQVNLNIEKSEHSWIIRWFNPNTAEFGKIQEISNDEANTTLHSPDAEQTWLVLVEPEK
ncbi:MAG: putative collagen-binding domain-containing protein, partial [bacterium]